MTVIIYAQPAPKRLVMVMVRSGSCEICLSEQLLQNVLRVPNLRTRCRFLPQSRILRARFAATRKRQRRALRTPVRGCFQNNTGW